MPKVRRENFQTESKMTVAIIRKSKVALELEVAGYHATSFTAYGSGYGEYEASKGILRFDAWTGFLDSWTSAEIELGAKGLRIWFVKEDASVAYFEGQVTSGLGAFVGEGKAYWEA